MRKTAVLTAILIAACALAPISAQAASKTAADITRKCSFTASSNAAAFKKAVDGKTSTVWTGAAGADQRITITVNTSSGVGGLYFRWNTPPPAWQLLSVDAEGKETPVLSGGGDGYLTDYEAIPSKFTDSSKFELTSSDAATAFSIAELSVFGPGGPPPYAPHWQPFTGHADIMIFSAHPDDDLLFMGSVIPTYSQQGKSAVTVYMTYGDPVRRFEAMEGAWTSGERIYPVLGPFKDDGAYGLDDYKKFWPEQDVAAFIVEQIRKYKPSVIVTHAIDGEYGHGAHIWTSMLVQQAFERSGDPTYYPDSAEKYGVWNAAKLYLHKYTQNKLTIDATVPLSKFGGKTAFEVATEAYARHFSQQHWTGLAVRLNSANNIRIYGLYDSRVGPDTKHDDMFENVSDYNMSVINLPYRIDLPFEIPAR